MRRTLGLLLVTLALPACSSRGSIVVVHVEAAPPISGIAQVHAVVSALGATRDFDSSASAAPVSTPFTFEIDLPPSASGSIAVHVELMGANGALGAGDGAGSITSGGTSDVTVSIGGAVDGGVDFAMPDFAMQDSAMPDLLMLDTADAAPPSEPRLIAPLSGAIVSSKRPTLKWQLPAGAASVQVDICLDRGCSTSAGSVTIGANNTAVPTADLAGGPVFWRVSAMSGGQTKTSVVWEFFVKAKSTNATVDTSFGSVPDFNGDGYADVVASAPNATVNSVMGVGRVYVIQSRGTTGLPTALPTPIDGRDQASSFFGQSFAAADVNGDGFPDLIVGVPISNTANPGKVYVFYGSASGVSTASPTAIIDPATTNGAFGVAVAAAGDVNGDGYADVIIGAASKTIGGVQGVGRVYVLYGSAFGLQTSAGSYTSIDGNSGDGMFAGFGSSVSGAGDVTGDGFADIAVGEPGAGKAFVYAGSASGIANNATPLKSWSGIDGATGGFGVSVSLAQDFNGDGYADLAVGYSQFAIGGNMNQGRVYVFLGSAGGFVTSQATIDSTYGAKGAFGYALTGGDVNGDGYSDLVVAAPLAANGGNASVGAVNLFVGSSTGIGSTATGTSPVGFGSPAGFGWSVSAAGDVNGDGTCDVIIGSISLSSFAGAVYQYGGGASGMTATYAVSWTGPDANGQFGTWVY